MDITIEDLKFILDSTPSYQNIMLMGKHGIGKSEILTKYYEKKGMKVIPLFVGQMSDPGDIIGLPYQNNETHRTEFMLPYWFPTDNRPIVLFLDELNRARPELMQVIMDLVLNKKLAGKKLPEGSIIISAINSGDEYILTDMDPALISRFNVYTFKPTIKEWLSWAINSGVNDMVIDFISTHEDLLDVEFCDGDNLQQKSFDRRSWTRVSDILNHKPFENSPVYRKMLCGIVGDIAGAKFFNHAEQGSMVKCDDILLNFDSVKDKIANYSVIRFSALSDRLCKYIDTEDIRHNSKYDLNTCYANMKKFLEFLMANNRENMAYMVSNYSCAKFPRFNAFIATNYELDTLMNKFISSIEII